MLPTISPGAGQATQVIILGLTIMGSWFMTNIRFVDSLSHFHGVHAARNSLHQADLDNYINLVEVLL